MGGRDGRLRNEGLGVVLGLAAPGVRGDVTSVFRKYRVRFDVQRLGVDAPPVEFRGRLMAALRAEGVDAVLWHTQPVTSFPIHQTHAGYGRGYPWSLAPGAGRVDPDQYQQAIRLLDSSIIICDEEHPIMIQPLEVMEAYATAFAKVLRHPNALVGD